MFPGGGLFAKLLVDISKYKIDEKVIGEGNFGVVKKGIRPPDKHHKEPLACAVKYIKAGEIKTKDDQAKFHNEIGCQAALKHVGILPLIGYTIPFMGKGNYTVITKFMDQGSLKDLIEAVEKGQAPFVPDVWERVKSMSIFGIAAAMAYVHQTDIIHRDLKTENVMLDEEFYPKIADFGLSKVFEEGAENQINMTRSVGTPLYMAPELISGENYNNSVDVFAYALILYELLTLKKPWEDKKNLTKYNLMQYVTNGQRPTIENRGIPEHYVELIRECWDGNPEARPKFIEIVKEFRDNIDQYFQLDLMDDEELFRDYVEEALKGLKFPEE